MKLFHCIFLALLSILSHQGAHGRSVCKNTVDLFDHFDEYVSSACFIGKHKSADEASKFCKDHNMNLFKITSDKKKKALFQVLDIISRNAGKFMHAWVTSSNTPHFLKDSPTEPNEGCLVVDQDPKFRLTTDDCSLKKTFLCEFKKAKYNELRRALSSDPMAQMCDHRRDLFDNFGYYISTLCYSHVKRSNTGAASMCKANNMRLFTVSDSIVQDALMREMTEMFGVDHGGVFWISGKGRPKYVDTNDGETPLFSKPTNDYFGGDCVALGSVGVFYYEIMNHPCNELREVLCEYQSEKVLATVLRYPKIVHCNFVKELYNSKGDYLKSTCWVPKNLNNEDATNFCLSNNMHLFTVFDAEERDAIFNSTLHAFGVKDKIKIWVSGVNEPRYLDSNLPSVELDPVTFPMDRQGGYCISLATYGKPHFLLIDLNCLVKQTFYCEWENPNPKRPE